MLPSRAARHRQVSRRPPEGGQPHQRTGEGVGSLPTTAGKGHYDGQHSAATVGRVRAALAEVRKRHKQAQPVERVNVPVPVDRPVVPEKVEEKVKEKSNWLT